MDEWDESSRGFVRRRCRHDEVNTLETEQIADSTRDKQVPEVNRVEAPAKRAQPGLGQKVRSLQ
jgi:hypothetical protein